MDNDSDIAIVGMSGRFPGARDLGDFWRNLAGGIESITRFTVEELLERGVPTAWLSKPNYVKAAPVLEEPERFDAGFFGFSPMEARTMDPQHRMLLELAHEALEHAACDPDRYPGRIGVFTGSALNTYFTNAGLNGRLAEDYIPTLIGNDKDFLSTRISYKLNLKGPSITVQTACSTALVAVHLARQSLLSQETDIALAGAVSVRAPHRAGYFCDGGGVVSPDGRVRAFDAAANGTVFGSGGGVLVLKRLADAIADGDTVHAVIKGSAVNNDGSEKAGYTAPSVNSQADAVVEALANAGIEADRISYVEAHGSGTPIGDPIEMRALTKAFRTFTLRSGYCAIGSVKTNVGHLDAAAGVAGMIKTILALEHRQLPPTLHFTEPNPEIDFSSTPFYVNTRLQAWESDGPRRAGVMSTGMGGTNAHVVLEEAPTSAASSAARPPHLLVLSAKTETALDEATTRLRTFLDSNEHVNMSDVAYTLQTGRKPHPHRRYLICANRNEARTALDEKGSKRIVSNHADESRRPVILLLPGVGDHYVGMAHDLYDTWPVFREEVERCAQILAPYLEMDIRNIIYPSGARWKNTNTNGGIDLKKMLARNADAPEDADARNLNQTLFAQPALFTIEYAMTRLWQSLGIVPDAIIGHSMGEYVAACIAGVLSLEDALRLIATRARLVNALPEAAMLAVTLPESELLALLPAEVSISLINGPQLCVVVGPPAAVAGFERTLSVKGIICRHVRNAHAFHSTMLEPIAQAFEAEVRKVRLSEPKIPYISNVTGTWMTRSAAANPAYWALHATRTARFSDALAKLWQFKNPILLEAGPGHTLTVLAMQHPARRDGGDPLTVSSIRHHYENQSDTAFLWQAIGKLWLSGAVIEWENAYRGEQRRRIPLPTYPFEGNHHWLEPLRAADATSHSSGLVRKNPNPSEWLYVPSWKRLLPMAISDAAMESGTAAPWLIFADEAGFTPALLTRLKSAGHDAIVVKAGAGFQAVNARTFEIAPENPEHYVRLIRALQAGHSLPDRILHAWSVTGLSAMEAEAGRRFTQAQVLGYYSLLFLAQALAAHSAGHDIRLFVLSNNVHEVGGAETLFPEKSTLLGPCMVIRQEYPNIRTKAIDVDLSGDVGGHDSVAALVLGECVDPDSSLCVAYRNGQRWVQTYEPVVVRKPANDASPFRMGGVYLITGGLGNIGIAIAEWLAEKYRAKLVLIGRSKLPGKELWNASVQSAGNSVQAKIGAIRRIDNLGGDVLYVNANVADASAMRRAVEQVYQRFGALHGVIHGAGIVGDDGYQEIKDCDHAHGAAHFQAKAHGALVLEEILHDKTLDFCLLLSSLASVLGGIGQAAYASANIFLDSFARRHNRASAVRWLSVNWDVWRVPEHGATDAISGKTLQELGMSAKEAMEMMETVLAVKTASQLVVSTGDLNARIDQWIRLESLDTSQHATAAGPVHPTLSARPALEADHDVPRDETEQQIARIWQDALGIDRIGIHDSFAALGGHSLLAIRIVSQLRKAFQIDLPVRALFDTPTIAALARHIEQQISAEIEALTDDEAARLVARG